MRAVCRLGFLPLFTLLLSIALLSIAPRAYAAGDVRVSMTDGRVSISARGATLRDILDAWAREGQTVFVHADEITNLTPLTLELADVREEEALDVLLRPLSGYMSVARIAPPAHVSRFERIVLLPTSVANHDSSVLNAAAPAPAPPVFQPPQPSIMVNGVARLIGPNGQPVEDDQQDAPPQNAPRGFSRGDAPSPAPPPQNRTPSTPATGTIVGSATPGVVVAPSTPPITPPPAQR